MPGNDIHFDRRMRDDLGKPEIVPRIDGTPLTELIDQFELGAGMTPAGNAYGGLVRSGPPDKHFHGVQGGKTPVLGCSCGDWGCWPLMARITVTDDSVVWDAFEQPHRRNRDYSGFGPFQFSRHHYDAALHDLITREP